MTVTIEDRGYRTCWSRKRITAESASGYARLSRMTPRRGFVYPKPTFAAKAFEVEVYAIFEHDEPAFAASFFSPIDAKAAIRAALS